MKTWQVFLTGEGFSVDGKLRDCEISGFINAESLAAAVEKVEAIVRQRHPELRQASGSFPRPAINVDEVTELSGDFPYPIPVNEIELHWTGKL